MSSVLRRLCCLLAALAALLPAARAAEVPRALVLPPGFTIELWAELEDARTLVLGGGGRTVYVGSRRAGTVTALRDTDGDGRADARWTLATGLTMPNGLAVRGDALYVADVDRLLRFARVEASFGQPVAPQVLRKDLPRDSAHGWRYLAFGPDGKLYLSIGAPCNVCEAPGYAELRRMDAEGRDEETVARGLRNSVGFAWRPGTRELWLTDNGRDWLGDDQPPDEIDILITPGAHFGFPYCHGGRLPDPQYGRGRSCDDYSAPALRLDAHVAPLGILFYGGRQFPAEYRGRVFVAEHGSWNRSRKSGYRVMMADVVDGRPEDYRPFLIGFERDGEVSGRPAYLLELPDGSLLLSDDQGGRIYRIRYSGGSGG